MRETGPLREKAPALSDYCVCCRVKSSVWIHWTVFSPQKPARTRTEVLAPELKVTVSCV